MLVLDGHVSHTGSLRAVELAAEHGVVMLSLPPHCSHRMAAAGSDIVQATLDILQPDS